MVRTDTALAAIHNAVENASDEPIDDQGVIGILQGAAGHPSHLRAVFGDVSLQSISAVAAAAGIGLETVLAAYAAAKRTALAVNPELDRELRERFGRG